MDSPVHDIHTAYHEAGHAVMALALGRNIQRVTIEPDPKRLGACEIKKGSFRPSPDVLETSVLIFYGGLVAEGRYRGQYCWAGAGQDLRDIRYLCGMRASGEKAIERLEQRPVHRDAEANELRSHVARESTPRRAWAVRGPR